MSGKSDRPVFIIGGSRTGSTMLQTILEKSPELDITDELLVYCPSWLHTDLATHVERDIGSLSADDALDKLVALLYSGKPFGWIYSEIEREMDRDLLREELQRQPLDMRSITHAMLVTHARMRNKSRIGAKFPMHYSFVDRLLEWYPNCLLIHTTRNPKAVYASQAAKYASDDDDWITKNYNKFKQFVHINLQVSWTARIHRRLASKPYYRLLRYEDLVQRPEQELRALCEFIDIEFRSDMLTPEQFGSSFDDITEGGAGIDQAALTRWRTTISPLTAKFIDIVHSRSFALFGYEREAAQ